jgi:hypothetical protein
MGAGIVGWQIITTSQVNSADKILTVTCTNPGSSILGGGLRRRLIGLARNPGDRYPLPAADSRGVRA